jgi:hypothetical protein
MLQVATGSLCLAFRRTERDCQVLSARGAAAPRLDGKVRPRPAPRSKVESPHNAKGTL